MKTTSHYLIIWALEDLSERFSRLDAAIDKALSNRDQKKYIEIIREKASILAEATDYVFQVAEGKDEKEKELQKVACHWAYSAHKFLRSSKIHDIDEILTQGGKNQIELYTKL